MVKLEVVARVPDDQQHLQDAGGVHLHGGKVFTCAEDTKVKVFGQNDLKLVHDFKAHDYAVNDLLVVGDTLFTCCADATVRMWDVNTLQLKKTIEGHEEAIRKLATSGDRVFSGDDKGEVRVYDLDGVVRASYNVVEEVWGLHAQDDLIYTVRDRGLTVTQLKGETNKFAVTASLEGRAPLCVVGKSLALPDMSGFIINVRDNTPISYNLRGTLKGHEMIITALGGWDDRLVSAGWDNTAYLWDLTSLQQLASCPLPGTASGIAATDDGTIFAVGSEGFVCKLKAS
ncbi:uncharacterized protein [Panulirus ornatus]|uniref:uncharacterized protein isoform X2 n=1 Tax=Panulirus ornatus TaxID=150431 RepID=UPI003A87BB3F